MSSLKDAFENYWRRRYGVPGAMSINVPVLDCFDSNGQATVDAIQRGLDQCRQRMADLRLKLREEEYIEEFFCGVLRDGLTLLNLPETVPQTPSGNSVIETPKPQVISNPPLEVKGSNPAYSHRATIAERRLRFEEPHKYPEVDGKNSTMKKLPKIFPKKTPARNSPVDEKTEKQNSDTRQQDHGAGSEARVSNGSDEAAMHDPEENKQNHESDDNLDLHVNQKDDSAYQSAVEITHDDKSASHRDPDSLLNHLVPKKSSDSDDSSHDGLSPANSVRRKKRDAANGSTSTDPNANDDENSEDESSNLMALRQSVTFANKWFEGVDSSRTRLEEQAQRLSKRFTQMNHAKCFEISKIKELDAVVESPASPSPSIGNHDHMGSGDGDWVATMPALLAPVIDLGLSPEDSVGGARYPERGEMRRCVVKSLLESEKSYMEILDSLINYKHMFKNFAMMPNVEVTAGDVETIFYRVAELHKIHYQFVRDLELKVANWSSDQQIAEIFKVLALEEYRIAPDYLQNYSKSLATIETCRLSNQKFDELTKDISIKGKTGMEKTTLEVMLHKPIVRFQRNTLLLHDLIKYTPTSHPDYDLLQKTLKFARRFLDEVGNAELSKDNAENQRYLVRHGLVVEKVNKARKLRHVFLFNDLVIGAKQKPPSRNRIQYEVKWFIPLTDISLEDKIGLKEDVIIEQDQREEVAQLQRKISELQAEYKLELKKAKQASESSKIKMRKPVTNKVIERIRKKLMEQKAALVIASPSLVFRLYNPKQQKQYLLMMSSDYERTDWRDSITGLLFKAPAPVQLTVVEVLNLINKQKLANAKGNGNVEGERDSLVMEDERLYGTLRVRVGQLQGLKQATKSVCRIEVDSFGHFTLKAKTNITAECIDPAWNEDFEIDLDGAQTLRILCYHSFKGADQLFGKGALELRSVWLKDGAEEDCVISINNEMSVSVSLQYTSREQAIPRCLSTVVDGLFGIRLDILTARERVPIPILVKSCVEEVEKRGLNEEGLYRVTGLCDAVEVLKKAFEKNSLQATSLLKSQDVNILTSLIKFFFRKLPESLFTDSLYKNFQEGIGLSDPEARDRCLVTLFGTLPEPNFSTALFLLDHLLRVAEHEDINKMTLKNIATVFGPTLLRPATRHSQTATMEQLFILSAHEAMMQTTILLQILVLRASGVEFKRAN